MNIILKRINHVEYFISCVKKHSDTAFIVYGKYISKEGAIRTQSKSSIFSTERQAMDRCHSLAKTKIRKKFFIEIPLDEVPDNVSAHLEIPAELQVTAQELILHIKEARKERYVIFKEDFGLDEFFDAEVEYLGLVTEDEDILTVFDRYGDPRQCFVERMKSIIPTEDAEQAKGMVSL